MGGKNQKTTFAGDEHYTDLEADPTKTSTI